ncbi:MAG: hypothetical protein J3R72DRAFT_225508 [Linnemannia gamsii]|nr:MAG: hypothetical protein J3R72DRAFT_225508 [Linnemannia gamsii]
MKDAVAKIDAAYKNQEETLTKAIQALRSNLDAARSDRDKARGSVATKESDRQKKHIEATRAMERDHALKVDRQQKESKANLKKLRATHDKQAESHETKFSGLMTNHHAQIETLKSQQEAEFKAKTKPFADRIAELNQRIEKAKGLNKSSSKGGPTASSQEVANVSKQISELQVQAKLVVE